MHIKRVITFVCIVNLNLISLGAIAATLADFQFTDPVKTLAFRDLTEQLRCLVCQNESLAASQAELAQDLRRKIYEMMQANKTTPQIIDFLVARYGDFILYNPPIKSTTYPLWYGPFILCGIAGLFLIRTLLRQRRAPDNELSAEERARLAAVIATQPSSQDHVL